MKQTKHYNNPKFDPERLDQELGTIQLWSPEVLLTANLKLKRAKELVKKKKAFIISSQAIGVNKENSKL